MYRKRGYIIARIIGFLLIVVMGCIVAVQTPYVQTRLSKIALNQLAAIMDGRVQYEELKVMASGVLVLRNVVMTDDKPYTADEFDRGWAPEDTLFKAKSISATFTLATLLKAGGIHVGRVTVEGGYFHLVTEPGTYKSNIERIFKLKSNGSGEVGKGELFSIKKARFVDFHFRLNNFQKRVGEPYSGFGLNYDDLDLVCNVQGHSLKFSDGRMYAVVEHCSVKDKSGYSITDIKGRCEVGRGKTLVEDLDILDPWSDIHLSSYSMNYANTGSFSHYITDVLMDARLRHSKVAAMTILQLAGAEHGNNSVFDIKSGHLNGYVDDFTVKGLKFTEVHSGVSSAVDGSVIGLPLIDKMMLDLKLGDLRFTTAKLTRLAAAWLPAGSLDLRHIAPDVNFSLDATAKGPLNRLDISCDLSSVIGNATASADIRNLVDKHRTPELFATLETLNLDLGAILGQDALGECTMFARAGAKFGKGLPDITLDSLSIHRIEAIGNTYKDIGASGSLLDGTVSATLTSSDPNLGLRLAALLDIKPHDGISRYRLYGEISELDLHSLKIDRRELPSGLSGTLYADLVKGRSGLLDGKATIGGLSLNNGKEHNVGDISFEALSNDGRQRYKLSSGVADISYTGDRPLLEFISYIQQITSRRELAALYTNQVAEVPDGRYSLGIDLHDTRDLMSFVMPGLYFADSTSVSLDIDGTGGLTGIVNSPRIAFGKNYMKNVIVNLDNFDNSLDLTVNGDELRVGDFALNAPAVAAFADDDNVSLGLTYESFTGAGGSAELYLDGMMYRDSTSALVIKGHPLDSYITAGGGTWNFGESNLAYRKGELYVDRFTVSNGAQSILIDGGVSGSRSDTLSLKMDSVDLSLLDDFLPKRYGIEGRMSGSAYLTSASLTAKGMLMQFGIDSARIGGNDIGSIAISGIWDESKDNLGILLSDVIDGRKTISANGSYSPDGDRLDLSATFDRLPLAAAAPFVSDFFSGMGGHISGGLGINGPIGNLSVSSDKLYLEKAYVEVAFTGVDYMIDGPLRADESGLYFDSLSMSDDDGGKASIAGAVRFDHLKDFSMDSRIVFSNLKFVDAPERSAGGFYGLLKASGNAVVTGPFSALQIDANIRTAGEGSIHIPVGNGLSSTTSNLLTFTQKAKPLDPYDEMLSSMIAKQESHSDMRILGKLAVTPDVKVFVEIDKSTGNVAAFNGSGIVNVNLRPSKAVFNLSGDYNINEGSYKFVLPGLITKDFTIQNGSSVKFGGDLSDAELDVTAVHSLKTSLGALISNSESSTRRLVDCMLSVSDKLKNPGINFAIDIPDLNPTTKSQVESALNTTDKVQKQFIALLLMGSFIPSETSGVVSGSDMLYSNMTELVSNQINSILRKLDIPLDVGFTYGGTNVFDVAISTQLFNNRVIVGGNLGNRDYTTSASGASGDMIGNLDIQVKLDNPGNFRLNLFSHSADEYSNYLDYSQRNGVGISYQREYNKFGEFLRSLFRSKETRDKEAVDNMEKAEKEQVKITIEQDEGQRETVSDTLSTRR